MGLTIFTGINFSGFVGIRSVNRWFAVETHWGEQQNTEVVFLFIDDFSWKAAVRQTQLPENEKMVPVETIWSHANKHVCNQSTKR